MKCKLIIVGLLICFSKNSIAQTNSIKIKAVLDDIKDELKIQQEITFYNKTEKTLNNIYIHNWAHSYSDRNTPLAKRFIEDYSKEFYFSNKKNKGNTLIHKLLINYQQTTYNEVINHPDILKITLNRPLQPNSSLVITANYTVKLPHAKFTNYGKTNTGYHLRFWHLVPAVNNNKNWQLMSNLNLDDLYMDMSDYTIEIEAPRKYIIESNLYHYTTKKENTNEFYLIGKNQKDIIISLDTKKKYKSINSKNTAVKTDLLDTSIPFISSQKMIKRQLHFIQSFLGKYPNSQIFVDNNSVGKNSLHDIYGLPSWLNPFPDNFKWEMRFFNALTIKYLEDVLILNKRKDYWLVDGIQTFLMMEYVKKYYPDITILGKYSNWWLIKSYNISKLKQNDKYPFVYQFSARRFYDQPLITRADSLSNFNRKVVSKYKAGLGLRYLQNFVGDSVLKLSLKQFYIKNSLKLTSSKEFTKILKSNTDKNLDWFFGDYITSDKKIDYKISRVQLKKDSVQVTIKNKRDFTVPVSLYGVKDRQILFKKWVTDVDSTKTITVPKKGYDKLALNFEQLYPEYNSLDNFRNINNNLINKPLQLRMFKDVENPYYNQLFITPNVNYNFYDGIIVGLKLSNKSLIPQNFTFNLRPNYSTKSENFTGGFSLNYNQFFRNKKIYRIQYNVRGSNFHYAPELSYKTFTPSVTLQFRRNTLRDVGAKFLQTRLIYINKEIPDTIQESEQDKYKVFNVRYINSKPNIIKDFRYAINLEIADNFSKISTDIRYRQELTKTNSFEARFFGGYFLHNNSIDNYFSFGLNRGSDYLFEQSLFGRSESSGLFSQQFVVADGGFKSNFNGNTFSNQLITSVNTSFGIWKWLEIYNDAAMLKSHNNNSKFFYENGVRFNFIPNIFEFYFPIYTNQGLQFNQNYASKIRFVISTSLDRIYNYIRRGLL